MEISVAMCTYNGEEFIEQQLQSILDQTLLPRQIVISDDGSSDETLSIIQQVWSRFKKSNRHEVDLELVIMENHTSLGVTKNFEQALTACTYPLIALSDQDDVWVPEKLEKLSSFFEQDKEVLFAFSNSRLVNEHGKSIGSTSFQALGVTRKEKKLIQHGHALQVFLRRNLATGATVMLKREILEAAVPFPHGWVHDEWLALISSCTGNVIMVDDSLIDYRQHSTNQIGMKKPTLRHHIGRLVFPRTERNFKLLQRAQAMSEHHFLRVNYPEVALEKLQHEETRQSYPVSRIRRLLPIIREVGSGRYWTCGLGVQDVARDLIQPV